MHGSDKTQRVYTIETMLSVCPYRSSFPKLYRKSTEEEEGEKTAGESWPESVVYYVEVVEVVFCTHTQKSSGTQSNNEK